MEARRLAIPVPAFLRPPIWVSDAALAEWGPRLAAVQAAVGEAEREAVRAGLQAVAVRRLPAARLAAETAWGRLAGVPVTFRAIDPQTLEVTYGVAGAVGPACCLHASRVHAAAGWTDQTWPLFVASVRDASGPAVVNPILQRISVAAIQHQPCSFRCERSRDLGEQRLALIRAAAPAAAGWLVEMLGWPMTWDARHGVVIIRTSLFRMAASTDPTTRVVFDRPGVAPVLTPRGHGAAFRPAPHASSPPTPIAPMIPGGIERTTSEAPAEVGQARPGANGFRSREAMTRAHATVLEAVPVDAAVVVDLGCGDGTLLEQIRARQAAMVWGIEQQADRAAGARVSVRLGSIRDWLEGARPAREVHALVALNRLREDPGLAADLAAVVGSVTVYSYEPADFQDAGFPQRVEAAAVAFWQVGRTCQIAVGPAAAALSVRLG